MKKVLFYVLSDGRKVEGEFGSKEAAKRFRDKHNGALPNGSKQQLWWVGVGHDHWKFKAKDWQQVPKRTEPFGIEDVQTVGLVGVDEEAPMDLAA